MKTSVLAACRHNSSAAAEQDRVSGQIGAAQARIAAPITQSAEAGAPSAQSLRLSSAWANNSASFGSFPDVSRISRFSMQPIAARRAGRLSPRQDQPES